MIADMLWPIANNVCYASYNVLSGGMMIMTTIETSTKLSKYHQILGFSRHLTNPKILYMFFLGFSSGLPFALVSSTLSAWYTKAGASLLFIGTLSLVQQPYVFKFLWSPLFDRYSLPFLGRRRGWILVFQLALMASIALMACFNPNVHPLWLAYAAVLVAILSASQDIPINAYQVDAFPGQERGLGAAASIAGWRIALIFSGAMALVLASYIGFQKTYLLMSLCMLIGIISTLFTKEPVASQTIKPPKFLYQTIIEAIKGYFAKCGLKMGLVILLTMILYKLGDAFALSLNTTFILRELHFSLIDLATVNKGVGITASILGSVVAGVLMTRVSLFRALLIFGLLQAVSNLGYMVLAMAGHNYPLFVGALFFEFFAGGLGNTAFVALIMSLCDKQCSATQFAVLSALTAIGRVYVGPSSALMIDHIGWSQFYFVTFLLALPGVGLLFVIRKYIH